MRTHEEAPSIRAVATAVPPHAVTTESALERYEALLTDAAARRQARSIFANSGVRVRHVARPVDEYPLVRGFGERNRRWQEDAAALARRVAAGALDRAGLTAHDVDHLVMATTTGLATPSLDAHLATDLGLRADVSRVPLFGLGCAGGAGSLGRASRWLAGPSDQVTLLVCVELCGHTFDPTDTSTLGMVAVSLFGDGAGAVVLAGARAASGRPSGTPVARVIDHLTHLWPDSRHIMGWEFADDGFKLVLSRELPALIATRMAEPVARFLERHGLTAADVTHPVIHPGGPRVLDSVATALGWAPERLALSRQVLAEVGNLSSASVLFVLDRLLASGRPRPGDTALVLAPGPGFALEAVLLRFEAPGTPS